MTPEPVQASLTTIDFEWKKSMVLIRGLPGSGKSTLGRKILNSPNKISTAPSSQVEADQFFEVRGGYLWNASLRDLAHQWCLAEAFRRLLWHDRIVVANTFVKRWQMMLYIEQARKFRIRVHLLEPDGNKLSPIALSQRNVHSVPVEAIERMKTEWEDMTQEEVNILLGIPVNMRDELLISE